MASLFKLRRCISAASFSRSYRASGMFFSVKVVGMSCFIEASIRPLLRRKAPDRGHPCRAFYKMRLNQSSESPADNNASTAAPSANKAEISVSFFSTVRRELSVL